MRCDRIGVTPTGVNAAKPKLAQRIGAGKIICESVNAIRRILRRRLGYNSAMRDYARFSSNALLVAAVAVSTLANAQSISGDLVVNVADPSSASVAGAKLILTDVDTKVRQELTTDSLGNGLFLQLKPGLYKLEATAAGFQTRAVNDIRIQVGQRARVNVEMAVGQLTESVTVSAAAATLLNSESAAIGQVMDHAAIVNLPLSGRNFLQLAALTSGAVPIGIGNSPLLHGPDAATPRSRLRAGVNPTTASS